MKKVKWLAAIFLLMASCQSKAGIPVTILDRENTYTLTTSERLPGRMLALARVTLGPNDLLLYEGSSVPLDQSLPKADYYTLVIRRAVSLTIITPDGQHSIQTHAPTVGQALSEDGFTLYNSDYLNPPAETPLEGPLTVTYRPSSKFFITVDGVQVQIRSAASSVGQALAEAGIPLIGLDFSTPSENDPLPADESIQVTRVVESVSLTQKSIPFATRTEPSADLEIDQQALVQGGEPGLSIVRMHYRSENGVPVSQTTESESILRPPQDQIMGYGTRIVIRTIDVDGQTIEYWRALTLYASNYSPCRSAGEPGKCYFGTSSGLPVQRGVVGMAYSWYLLFGFEHIYIPGYGFAVVGDSGRPPQHYWVDQAWSEEEYLANPNKVSGWVTVYFLTPVPANPGYILP
jgi:uncharacterized protein YabE (DUF348 family)